MNKKDQLQVLVQGSLFLKPETKNTLLQELENLLEPQIDALIDLLKEAEEKQIFLVQKILEKNPNFLEDIQHMAIEEITKARKEAEKRSDEEEKSEMDDLEKKLNSL